MPAIVKGILGYLFLVVVYALSMLLGNFILDTARRLLNRSSLDERKQKVSDMHLKAARRSTDDIKRQAREDFRRAIDNARSSKSYKLTKEESAGLNNLFTKG